MPRDDFIFRRLNSDDWPDFFNLFQDAFGTPANTDVILWKHIDLTNQSHQPLIYLAVPTKSNTIGLAGAVCYFPVNMQTPSGSFLAVQAGDVMVSRHFQRRGLFKRMIAYAEQALRQDGITLIYGFPNDAAYPGWRSMGYATVSKIEVRFFPLRPTLLASNAGPIFRMAAHLTGPIWQLVSLSLLRTKAAGLRVKRYSRADDLPAQWDGFHGGLNTELARRPRGRRFFSWRYDSNPRKESRFEYVEVLDRDSKTHGLFVTAHRKNGQLLEICEFQFPDPSAAKECLAALALHYSQDPTSPSAIVWRNLLSQPYIRHACQSTLFLPRRKRDRIIMKWLTHNPQSQANGDFSAPDWYFSAGDMDTI